MRSVSAWVGSLQVALTFLLSPVSSALVNVVGIRRCAFFGTVLAFAGMFSSSFVSTLELYYLTYGMLLGAGSSLVYTPSIVILGHYFNKRLGLVNGIVSVGSAVFTIFLPIMMVYTLQAVGLPWTLRFLSLFHVVLLGCTLTWKPQFSSKPKTEDEAPKKSVLSQLCNLRIWRNKGYRIWATAVPIAFLGYFIPFVHLVGKFYGVSLRHVV